METFRLAHFPAPVSVVHVALFDGVRNAPEIRRRLVAAATAGDDAAGVAARAAVDFAFVEADLLVSRQHLLAAIQTTLLSVMPTEPAAGADTAAPALRTRSHNVHSELLLCLSPNNNITDSIRRHGLGDSTARLAVVRFGDGRWPGAAQPGDAGVYAAMRDVVDGELVPLSSLDDGPRDWARIDKIFKLAEMNRLDVADLAAAKRAAVINAVTVKSVM